MTDTHREIFLSADVETPGHLLGHHRPLSVGACAIDLDWRVHGRLHLRILPVQGADLEDPDSRRFWTAHPDAWAEATTDAPPAPEADRCLRDFALNQAPPGGIPPLAAWPLAFDSTWISWLPSPKGPAATPSRPATASASIPSPGPSSAAPSTARGATRPTPRSPTSPPGPMSPSTTPRPKGASSSTYCAASAACLPSAMAEEWRIRRAGPDDTTAFRLVHHRAVHGQPEGRAEPIEVRTA